MGEAALWGLAGASSLLIGAGLGLRAPISDRVLGLVLGFGAGTLFSALAFELTEEAFTLGGADAVAIGLALGAVAYYVGDREIERRGGRDERPRDQDLGRRRGRLGRRGGARLRAARRRLGQHGRSLRRVRRRSRPDDARRHDDPRGAQGRRARRRPRDRARLRARLPAFDARLGARGAAARATRRSSRPGWTPACG